MGQTKIPYADRTWELTGGCRRRSDGCRHCWAIRQVRRLAGHPAYRDILSGLVERCEGELKWTGGEVKRCEGDLKWTGGEVERCEGELKWTGKIVLLEHLLDVPKKMPASRIFVNSKAELFDEQVPFEYLGKVFNRMAHYARHRYFVLTKEAERLEQFILAYQRKYFVGVRPAYPFRWPGDFEHVMLAVSVESPKYIDRIETLRRLPAAMRGVSLEPLIEPVDLTPFIASGFNVCRPCGWWGQDDGDPAHGQAYPCPRCDEDTDAVPLDELLDWVIVGCEKLPGGWAGRWAGEDPLGWWTYVTCLVRDCSDAGVPLFVKQGPRLGAPKGERVKVTTDMSEFPPECRVQQVPASMEPDRKGKR